MARVVGLPKTGGRKKGTPNKSTLDLQEALESRGVDIVGLLAQTLPELTADRRADVLIDLMTFVYPKRKAVELNTISDVESLPRVIVTLPSNGREAC